MDLRYMPTTPHGRRARLSEEIGEVMIEAGKALRIMGKIGRFGLDSQHPDGGPTNREALLGILTPLISELNDLHGAVVQVEEDLREHLDEAA